MRAIIGDVTVHVPFPCLFHVSICMGTHQYLFILSINDSFVFYQLILYYITYLISAKDLFLSAQVVQFT